MYYQHHPCVFFFNDTATTEIYTLSLHDALPISPVPRKRIGTCTARSSATTLPPFAVPSSFVTISPVSGTARSEEHTSELQSQSNLVCRLLLEKKKEPGKTALILASPTPTVPSSA